MYISNLSLIFNVIDIDSLAYLEISVSQLSDCLPGTSEDLLAMVDAEVKCTIH